MLASAFVLSVCWIGYCDGEIEWRFEHRVLSGEGTGYSLGGRRVWGIRVRSAYSRNGTFLTLHTWLVKIHREGDCSLPLTCYEFCVHSPFQVDLSKEEALFLTGHIPRKWPSPFTCLHEWRTSSPRRIFTTMYVRPFSLYGGRLIAISSFINNDHYLPRTNSS
jgi:hypothetical protein